MRSTFIMLVLAGTLGTGCGPSKYPGERAADRVEALEQRVLELEWSLERVKRERQAKAEPEQIRRLPETTADLVPVSYVPVYYFVPVQAVPEKERQQAQPEQIRTPPVVDGPVNR